MDEGSIDRKSSTPFLLHIFGRQGQYHDIVEFEDGQAPRNGITLYAWKDTTLGELVNLFAKDFEGLEEDTETQWRIRFRLVYGNYSSQRYETREVGVVHFGMKTFDYKKTLDEARFVIGDWIDVAIVKQGDRLYENSSRRESYNGHSHSIRRDTSGSGRMLNKAHQRAHENFRKPYERNASQNYRRDSFRRDTTSSFSQKW